MSILFVTLAARPARTAEVNKVVDNNFFYDTKRANSNVVSVDSEFATMDDNPPY